MLTKIIRWIVKFFRCKWAEDPRDKSPMRRYFQEQNPRGEWDKQRRNRKH